MNVKKHKGSIRKQILKEVGLHGWQRKPKIIPDKRQKIRKSFD